MERFGAAMRELFPSHVHEDYMHTDASVPLAEWSLRVEEVKGALTAAFSGGGALTST